MSLWGWTLMSSSSGSLMIDGYFSVMLLGYIWEPLRWGRSMMLDIVNFWHILNQKKFGTEMVGDDKWFLDHLFSRWQRKKEYCSYMKDWIYVCADNLFSIAQAARGRKNPGPRDGMRGQIDLMTLFFLNDTSHHVTQMYVARSQWSLNKRGDVQ